MFHGAGQAASLALGVNLVEGFIRAVKIFAAGSALVNIVRDGPGVRLGNGLLGAAVGIDINLPVIHVDQEEDGGLIPEVFDGIGLGVSGGSARGMAGGNKGGVHIFRDPGMALCQLCLFLVRQKIRAVIHDQCACRQQTDRRKEGPDQDRGQDRKQHFFHGIAFCLQAVPSAH